MRTHKINFSTLPWQSPLPNIRFKVYEQDDKRIRLVEYSAGFEEPDWCVKGHIGYVLEGRVEIDFDGDVVNFEAGDGIFIPAGEEHKHKARPLSESVRVVLVEDVL